MAVDTLAVFGDSWPAGEELSNPRADSFPKLLSEKLNLKLINLSQSATSIDQAVLNLLNNVELLKKSNVMILFCLTSIARSMHFSGPDITEIHPNSKSLASLSYYSHIYTNELGEFNLLRNMLLLQNTCKQLEIPIFFVLNWNNTITHQLLDQSLVCSESFFNMIDLDNIGNESNNNFKLQLNKNKYIFPNYSHPNINGHRVISDKLFNWLKEKL